MALIEIKVPDIGDFKDVAVIELLVKPGDAIQAEQSLVTVESDKASMEIPSSHAGVVKELKVALGDKVNEGTVLLMLESAGAAAPTSAPASAPAAPPPRAPAPAGPRPWGAPYATRPNPRFSSGSVGSKASGSPRSMRAASSSMRCHPRTLCRIRLCLTRPLRFSHTLWLAST